MSCNIYTPTVNDVCGKSKFKSTVENVTIEVKTDEFLVWYEVTYKYYNSYPVTFRCMSFEEIDKKLNHILL